MSEGNRVKDVKYHASASFDIETDIRVEDDADDLEIFLTIVSDLESRYGLEISFTLAKRKHCVVEIDCKYCIVQVDESMTLESGRQQVESIIYS